MSLLRLLLLAIPVWFLAGGERTGLSWPYFNPEDILSLLSSPVSFPQFPEDLVFLYCLWRPISVSWSHPYSRIPSPPSFPHTSTLLSPPYHIPAVLSSRLPIPS